jgi:multidrug efflux pump subunit AcrA (membrane-fusion protein)
MQTGRTSWINQAYGMLIGLWVATALVGELVFPAPDQHGGPEPSSKDVRAGGLPSQAENLDFLGEIVPNPQLIAEVVAPLWGKIYLEDGVYEGAKVKQGQPLAYILLELDAVERLAINDRTLDIEQFMEIWQRKARSAWNSYQRAVEINKTNPEFQKEVDRRKKIYDKTLLGLQIADRQHKRQTDVLRTRDPRKVIVTAPLSGFISEIYFVSGDVNPFDQFRKLFLIVDLSTVWVRADIFEKDLWIIREAPNALIGTSSSPDEIFEGSFQALGSAVDPVTRTIPAYYEIPNPTDQLKIGMRVRLRPVREAPTSP